MTDQKEILYGKRQHDSIYETEEKYQKLDDNEEEEKEDSNSLTDICSELLLRILNFLDLESLLNVAHTCKRLQFAAITTFSDNHGKKRICFYTGFKFYFLDKRYQKLNDEIRIYDFRFCLPFVRCFGAKFMDLSINRRDKNDHKCIRLDRYINQYCANTLTSISVVSRCLSNNLFF